MEERKDDPRIYVVSTIFLAFIISGGIFLGLYIFLPADQVKHWYPTVGLTLVAIPWAFWFLTYVYRCIRPEPRPGQSSKSYSAGAEPAAETTPPSSNDQQSVVESSSDGGRHVHFGGVVVINDDDDDNNKNDDGEQGGDDDSGGETGHSGMENDQSSNGTTSHENSVNSRESEIPLTHNVSS